MVSPPQYISIAEDVLPAGHDVILLGNQGNSETVAFQMMIKAEQHHPVSTSAPWKISHIEYA